MRRRPALTALLATTAAGAALAGHASAATLSVSPGSTRAMLPCAAATPCTLEYALTTAGSGDDIALAPGDYFRPGTQTPLDTLPQVAAGVVLHGDPAGPAPVLHGLVTGNAKPFLPVAGTGAVRDLEIRSAAKGGAGIFYSYGVSMSDGALLDRVVVRATGVSGTWTTACSMLGGTIRDSVCLGDGGTGRVDAVGATSTGAVTYVVRNSTVVTTAPFSVGLRLGVSSQTSSMEATDVVARGTSYDVESGAGLATGHATLTIDHSNWITQYLSGTGTPEIVSGANNQTGPRAAEPLFVAAAAGDFRQRPGSPTIDAGAATPLAPGELALGGAPRVVGATADIGADEFVPAPAKPITTGTTPSTADTSAPVLAGLGVARRRGGAAGIRVRLSLSEPAAVTLSLARLGARGRVVATRRRTVSGAAGANLITLPRRLAAGRYRLTVATADAAGNRGAARTARFSVGSSVHR